MIDIGGGHRVWTKKLGNAAIKVLLLHGGPGADHSYFECFEDFLPQNGIEFYYYDQLDSTNSDKPGDPKLWTIERFRDEVEAVRSGLNLDQFYLFGHSWGGMLAIEYALAYQQHLKGLVLSNTTAAVLSPVKHVAELRAALPEDARAILDKYEKAGQFDAPEYQKIMMEQVYTRHLCRLKPWPEPVERALRNINAKLYTYMFGPNEWVVTGTVKDWNRWADLPRIHTRTLLMGAKYDELPGEDMRKMAASMPSARAWISEKGSHFTMWDDQVSYFRELLGFLKST
jgi:proline iminopeptidase